MADPAIISGNQAADVSSSSPTSRLVAGVVAVLEAEMTREFYVGPMPDKPADFDLGEREGAVLVHYRSGKGMGVDADADQQRELTIDVHLRLRGLAGRFGVAVQLDAVMGSLLGRQIQGSTRFRYGGDQFVQERDGIWDHVVTFTTTQPAVARRHPDWRPY
ncbi:MAG: hypothetical protein DI527_16410 [Chelatococcus sp.]|nr:MAG: hypothetical protein DI527_16410 [Chelatococcus sp.]